MAADPIPHEMLLAHAGFLRRLARDLVGDPSAADDAVQEVYLRALERPPRNESNLRAWLRTVLTNLIRTRARNDSRRTLRELDRLQPEAFALQHEHESALRSVTEAVLALEEPLRSTVLQHYFQGLSSSEIAEREHLPVSTVKSRLQRALEILRARMKRENGGAWSRALIALVVPAAAVKSVPIAGVGKGVLAMTMKTKIAAGVALLLAAWFLIHEFTGVPGGPSQPLAGPGSAAHTQLSTPSASPPSTKPSLETDSTSAERAPSTVPPDAQATPGVDEPPDTLLMGSFLDAEGKPLRKFRSAWCSITSANGLRMNCDASQGGAFIFAHVPYGKYWITGNAMGFRMAHEQVELTAGVPHARADLRLRRQPVLRILATTSDGTPLREALGQRYDGQGGITLVPVATREAPGSMINEVVGSLNNPFGIGNFWQTGPLGEPAPRGCLGFVLLDEDPPAYISLLNWHAVLQTKQVQPGDEEVHFVLRPEDVLASTASVRVQVLDSDGQKPLAGAHVGLVGRGEEEAGAQTGPDGFANLEKILPIDGQLVVSAPNHARVSLPARALPGVLTDLGQVVLDSGLTLNARVTNPAGEPVSANFLLLRFDHSTGKHVADEEHTYSSSVEGLLTIPDLGREPYLLRTSNLDAFNDQGPEGTKFVSTNIAVDLRTGLAPNALEIRLVPASTLTLILHGETNEHMGFRVADAQDHTLVAGRFWWLTPYPLSLPPGAYRVEFLEPDGTLISAKAVTLGSTPMTVELSR
jgi:RNA polymerase sigma factor (sigma-70 family)